MKPKKRQKLCHNCEGEIDLDVIVCPFCAADLREEKPEQRRASYTPSFMQTGQSLYPPPPRFSPVEEREEQVEAAPAIEQIAEPVVEEEAAEPQNIFRPIVFFTLGVQLFLFGFLILLFSHKGTITLSWDASFWYCYVLASIPFLYFGYKAISKL